VARAAGIAALTWDARNVELSWCVARAAEVGRSPGGLDLRLAQRVLERRWPLREPSPTEIRRAEALAVAWDRLTEEVEPTATLTTVQALCSYWTALELGLDPERPLDWDGIVIRAVAERLQLAPQHLPAVREAIASVLGRS
jgi:hypothetical protein